MNAASAIVARHEGQPEVTEILEQDLKEVAAFIAAQSGHRNEEFQRHLRWFLLENPAREHDHPLGFALRSSTRIVGCILCSPQKFRIRDTILTMMGSSCFYVDETHRGHGGRIFLQYSRLANRWPLFGTSANSQAAALWKASGARPVAFADCELFGVVHWPPVVEEFMHRKRVPRWFSRLAAVPLSSAASAFWKVKIESDASLHRLSSVAEAHDLLIQLSPSKLTSLRDSAYLRWRYFSGRDLTAAVFAFRSHNSDVDVMVAVNQRIRGYCGQINTLNVLDMYPMISLHEVLSVCRALMNLYQNEADAIVLRHQNLAAQQCLCKRGFRRRAFDAPNGWILDKSNLIPSCESYFVPADGDELI
jgi:hypothetical protein